MNDKSLGGKTRESNKLLGARIKERRKALKMSQKDLAKLSGYTDRSTISRAEKGAVDLPESKIVAIANALNISPQSLVGWEEKNEESMESIVAKFKDFNSLLNHFINKYSLSEGEQQELEKILQFNVLLFKDTDITTAGKKKLKISLLEIYVEALLEKRKKEGR